VIWIGSHQRKPREIKKITYLVVGSEFSLTTYSREDCGTGDKGSNTQWVHAEHIVITVNK
jgi:hypothetical protein